MKQHVFNPRSPFDRGYTPNGTSHFRRGHTTASEPAGRDRRSTSSLCCASQSDLPAQLAAQSARQADVARAAAEAVKAAARTVDEAQRADRAASAHLLAAKKKQTAMTRAVHASAEQLAEARDEQATSAPAALLGDTQHELDEAMQQVVEAQAAQQTALAEATRLDKVVATALVKLGQAQEAERSLTQELDEDGSGTDGSATGALEAAARASSTCSRKAEAARAKVGKMKGELAERDREHEESETKVRHTYPEGPPHEVADAAKGRRGSASARMRAAAEAEAAAKENARKLDGRLKRAVQRCQAGGVPFEQLQERARRAQAAIHEHENASEQSQRLHDRLQKAVSVRSKFWIRTVKSNAIDASGHFNRSLTQKGLAGGAFHACGALERPRH